MRPEHSHIGMPSSQAFCALVLGVHTSRIAAQSRSEFAGSVLNLCKSVGGLLLCCYLIYGPVPQCTACCISERQNYTGPGTLNSVSAATETPNSER